MTPLISIVTFSIDKFEASAFSYITGPFDREAIFDGVATWCKGQDEVNFVKSDNLNFGFHCDRWLGLPRGSHASLWFNFKEDQNHDLQGSLLLKCSTNINRIVLGDLQMGGRIDALAYRRMSEKLPSHAGEKLNNVSKCLFKCPAEDLDGGAYLKHCLKTIDDLETKIRNLFGEMKTTLSHTAMCAVQFEIKKIEFSQDLESNVRWNLVHAEVCAAVEDNLCGGAPRTNPIFKSKHSTRWSCSIAKNSLGAKGCGTKRKRKGEILKRNLVAGSRIYFGDFEQYKSFEDTHLYRCSYFSDMHLKSATFNIAVKTYVIDDRNTLCRIEAFRASNVAIPISERLAAWSVATLDDLHKYFPSGGQMSSIRPRATDEALFLMHDLFRVSGISRLKELKLLKGKAVHLSPHEQYILQSIVISSEGRSLKPQKLADPKAVCRCRLKARWVSFFARSIGTELADDTDWCVEPREQDRELVLNARLAKACLAGHRKLSQAMKADPELKRMYRTEFTRYRVETQFNAILRGLREGADTSKLLLDQDQERKTRIESIEQAIKAGVARGLTTVREIRALYPDLNFGFVSRRTLKSMLTDSVANASSKIKTED